MSYEIDIEQHETHVRVRATGERRTGDAAVEAGQVGKKIVELCTKTDIFKVMVVLNLRGRLSAVDSMEIVDQSKGYGWDHRFKLAFVDTNDASAEDVKFTETVAVNRAYQVRQFTDEDEALTWLLG